MGIDDRGFFASTTWGTFLGILAAASLGDQLLQATSQPSDIRANPKAVGKSASGRELKAAATLVEGTQGLAQNWHQLYTCELKQCATPGCDLYLGVSQQRPNRGPGWVGHGEKQNHVLGLKAALEWPTRVHSGAAQLCHQISCWGEPTLSRPGGGRIVQKAERLR